MGGGPNPGVTVNGILVPGYNPNNPAGPGATGLAVNATSATNPAVTLNTGSQFDAYLTSSTASSNYVPTSGPPGTNLNLPPASYLDVTTGVVTISTGVTLNLFGDSSVHAGESFTIIDPSTTSGQFSSVTFTDPSNPGLTAQVYYNQGLTGQDVVVTLVPEPSSWLLAAFSAAGLLGWQWRRRRNGCVGEIPIFSGRLSRRKSNTEL